MIKSPRDFWAGIAFMAIAAAFVFMAWGYRYGTAQRMGPAYFPTVVACVLGFLGFVIFARSFALKGPPVDAIGWRQLLVTLLAVVVFGFVLAKFGVVASICALVLVGAFADQESRPLEIVLLAVFLAAFSVGVFVYMLGLPLQVWPEGVREWFLATIGRG